MNNEGHNRDTHKGHPYGNDENNDENIVGAIPCGCPIPEVEDTHKGHPYGNDENNDENIVGAIPCGCPIPEIEDTHEGHPYAVNHPIL